MKNEIADMTPLSETDMTSVSLNKNFVLRSEETQEVISRKPDPFEKWALLIFLLIITAIAAGSWFIKYPDTIEGSAMLTGMNAPKEIVPQQTGKLTALLVKNNQQVKQGDVLGWIESNADTKEVIDLAFRLNSGVQMLDTGSPLSIAALFDKHFTRLGELQTAYQVFIAAKQQYSDYFVNDFYLKRKNMLLRDIAALQHIKEQATEQKELTAEDNALAKSTFEMNKKLYEEKVISKQEYRQAQSALLSKQQSLPQINANITSQDNQIRSKQKEIDQLEHDILQQQQTFEQAMHTLKSSVDDWLKRYTIQSPADGAVVFALPLQQNQYIEQGKLLGYVNPRDSKYYAEIKLAQYNFGKVDTGMKVQLRFYAYPYQETGFLSGTLNYLSDVTIDSSFLGTIQLDNGLITNQHKTIQYKNGLKAQALIITKDMRLPERLYYSIIKSIAMNQ
ncbi:HlyD family secretion protein [Agriterribacter sp.]|uniref:HlyD family secretion protein n=1 Tax=Agriterribacter sp. TaxID=2821509 RepID=UPI002CBA5D1B|nr:biotin/lipoyl-binding protein [Agriterribacter sp.]HTN08424.1 biotin/lipoyl-binding protein [Agriterribacter sp.]